MATDLPKRRRRDSVTALGAAIARQEAWDSSPNEVWFSKWAPLPRGMPHGPYAKPTRPILLRALAGLERRRSDGQQ